MYKIGLDLGSSYTKGVLVDSKGAIIGCSCVKTGYDFAGSSKRVFDELSKGKKIDLPVFSCGYGREQLTMPFVANSEIMAVARAVYEKYKCGAVILDIGGQDTKYIKITDAGQVDKFKLNKKCAAGTGAFLEEIAFRLGVAPEEFDMLAKKATEEIKINSFCTVFAVSEIVGLIKKGVALPNIIMGIYNSIVERALELAPLATPLILTGGIPAMHPMIVKLFQRVHPSAIFPEKAQFMAALGAVLINTRQREA